MRLKWRDFREDAWYELLRLCVLWITAVLLVVVFQYMRGNRVVGHGNRRVNCATLQIQLKQGTFPAQQKVYQENC